MHHSKFGLSVLNRMSEDEQLILCGAKEEKKMPARSLGELILSCLEKFADRVALVQRVSDVELSLSYADLLLRSQLVASLLREHSLLPGGTVMLCCGNTLEFAPIMFGTIFAGAAVAPVDPDFETSDFLHLIGVIKPNIIICDSTSDPRVRAALIEHNSSITLLTMAAVNQRLTQGGGGGDFKLSNIEDPEEAVAILLCSSGTTGKHKGVEMVHSRLVYLTTMIRYLPDPPTGVQQAILNLSGPYWASCMLMTLYAISKGMRLVLLQSFTADSYLEHIQAYKINIGMVGPQALISLAKHDSLVDYDTSSLYCILSTGAPMSAAMLELAQKTLKTNIAMIYGMTECMGQVEPAALAVGKPCNVGPLNDNVAAKVVDIFGDGKKTLGPNCDGELCFRNPACFKAYRGNPEATRAAFDDDGFLHTGDVGHYDEDGYFYVVDRIKELIKYKGNHVAVTDIEEVLLKHRAVKEAAVIGVFNETDWEHATGVVVVKQGETVTEEELVTLVQGQLSHSKWLYGGVKFVEALPRTASGKIQKQVLRTIYSQQSM